MFIYDKEKFMTHNQSPKKTLTAAIVSLSMLTVMAGAAVAPALNVIKAYFADCDPMFVQMIVSMPAIFIFLTSFIFPKLCNHMGTKTLVILGLVLYVIGGCAAGLFSNIILVLIMRAIVGIGVGIIMPLSTGLLSFYYPPGKQAALMGLSSAMNQMGGVIATLISGALAAISWRATFLVYLMGLISIVLCIVFMPNDRMHAEEHHDSAKGHWEVFKNNHVFIIAMFLHMAVFFVYPTNFAIETVKEGIVPAGLIAVIMAGMDLVAFFGGLLFVQTKRMLKQYTKFAAPVIFLIGYVLMAFVGGWPGILIGSAFVGFANGAGVPFIMSEVSMKAGRAAATTVMPMLSAALYLGQFLCPILIGAVTAVFGNILYLPYYFAIVLSVLAVIWAGRIHSEH